MALNNSEKQEVQRTRLGPSQIGTLLTPESLIPINERRPHDLEGLIPANQHAKRMSKKKYKTVNARRKLLASRLRME